MSACERTISILFTIYDIVFIIHIIILTDAEKWNATNTQKFLFQFRKWEKYMIHIL